MKGERVPTLELARDDVEHFGHDGRLEIVGVVPSDAFISPDDPMVRDPFRAAMIYPDKPILRAEEEAGVVGCGSEWGRMVPLFVGLPASPGQRHDTHSASHPRRA
jgi:hypothetical protein